MIKITNEEVRQKWINVVKYLMAKKPDFKWWGDNSYHIIVNRIEMDLGVAWLYRIPELMDAWDGVHVDLFDDVQFIHTETCSRTTGFQVHVNKCQFTFSGSSYDEATEHSYLTLDYSDVIDLIYSTDKSVASGICEWINIFRYNRFFAPYHSRMTLDIFVGDDRTLDIRFNGTQVEQDDHETHAAVQEFVYGLLPDAKVLKFTSDNTSICADIDGTVTEWYYVTVGTYTTDKVYGESCRLVDTVRDYVERRLGYPFALAPTSSDDKYLTDIADTYTVDEEEELLDAHMGTSTPTPIFPQRILKRSNRPYVETTIFAKDGRVRQVYNTHGMTHEQVYRAAGLGDLVSESSDSPDTNTCGKRTECVEINYEQVTWPASNGDEMDDEVISVGRGTDFHHVIDTLNKMKEDDKIRLCITDAHGDEEVNQALVDAIKQCKGQVVVVAKNVASAGSLLWSGILIHPDKGAK